MKKKLASIGDGCFLPMDIVENILLRLPTKTLWRSKIVSKEWKSLISSGSFKRLHDERALKKPNLILMSQYYIKYNGEKKPFFTTIGLDGDVLDQWNLASVGLRNSTMLPSPSGPNNIVCFVVEMKRFVLCNPSTRQVCLPEPCSDNSMFYFPPKFSKAGFGYLHSRNQYLIVTKAGRKNWQMITFSKGVSGNNHFKVDGWKPIKGSARYAVDGLPWGVFANGILYWIGHAGPHRCLTCFDLCEERFFLVLMPDEVKGSVYEGSYWLLELNGDLHLMYRKARQWNIELWKLDDVRNQRWTKQYIRVTGFQASFGSHFRPVMVDEDGEMLVYNGGLLEWYRLQDGVFRISEKGYKRIPGSQYVLDFKLHTDLPFF